MIASRMPIYATPFSLASAPQGVQSVGAGDASIVVGGTLANPTVSVAANGITSGNVADGALSPAKISGTAATLGANSFSGNQSIGSGSLTASGGVTGVSFLYTNGDVFANNGTLFGKSAVVSGNGLNLFLGNVGCGAPTLGLSANPPSCSTFFLGYDGAQSSTFFNRPSGGRLAFRENNGSDQMTVASGGNVGIGTINPQAHLHALATSGSLVGVLGESTVFGGTGVQGNGSFIGVVGTTPAGNGSGVEGRDSGPGGTGVYGNAFGDTAGATIGVRGAVASPNGTGGLFQNTASGNLIVGVGTSRVFRVDWTGKVFADGGYQTGGADFAESFAVVGKRASYEPGDVVVIEQAATRRVALAQEPYSTLVAGIYSTKPGILATPHGMDDSRLADEIPLAIVGIVPCKVTAENGAIRIGDLLVTSSTPGHAMKGTDRERMLGAVVGKALEPLASGVGVIQVLVTLQ